MSRGVLVLGMHRSGTSAATGLLALLGLELLADDALPPDSANPRGYWESSTLVAENDRILDALGFDWTCPPAAGPAWDQDPLLLELASPRPPLPERFARGGWVWKDPRNCLTLPYWLRATDLDPVLVLVHRDPLEVAASLAARDRLDETTALALWERYVRHSLAAAAGRPALVTSYAEVLDDPVRWSHAARAFLGAHAIDGLEVDAQAASELVDRQLRRQHPQLSRAELSRPQLELAGLLERLRGPHSAFDPGPIPPETPGLDGVFSRRRRDRTRALERTVEELLDSRSYRYTAAARWFAGRLRLPGLRPSA